MLWDLYGEMSGQVYRSWNTCVKLVWDLPRSTHNYLMEQTLAKDCYNMMDEFNMDPWTQPATSFAKEYKMYETSAQDTWRSSLLLPLMKEKHEMDVSGEDVETISGLIESLCSS